MKLNGERSAKPSRRGAGSVLAVVNSTPQAQRLARPEIAEIRLRPLPRKGISAPPASGKAGALALDRPQLAHHPIEDAPRRAPGENVGDGCLALLGSAQGLVM